jgi:TP901 family phage tail tape measure protein
MDFQAINLTGQSSSAVQAANAYAKALESINAAHSSVIKSMVTFNEQGAEMSRTVVSMVNETQKLTSTIKDLGNNEVAVINKIENTTNALKQQAAAAKTAQAAMNTQNRNNVESQVRGTIPIPANISSDRLVSYEANLQKVLGLMQRGKLTMQEFDSVFKRVQSGDRSPLNNFTDSQSKAFAAMVNMKKAIGDLDTEYNKLNKSSQQFGLSRANAFNITEALLLKQAIAGITGEIGNAISKTIQFQITISQIRTISQESQSTFMEWEQTLTKVSDTLGLPVTDVAAAAYDALSNQITEGAAATEKFLMVAGEFGRVTQSSTKDSVNLLSSVINAYKLDVNDADRISAAFFKTIDLGRIKATDIANSIGRVIQPASALGVSFEEVGAALSVLTRNGVTASDAQTQLLNLFTRMLKPTGELKELLASWGTPTAEAAIATFGFAGVLEKLQTATRGASTELAQLFPDIRGLRGASGLTSGGAFKDFEKDLAQIKNSMGSFDAAKAIRSESTADKIVKDFTSVSNFFTNELGKSVVQVTKNFGDFGKMIDDTVRSVTGFGVGLNGVGDSLKTLTTIVVAGAAGWGTYKAVVYSTAPIIATLEFQKRRLAAASAAASQAAALNTTNTNLNTTAQVANASATRAATVASRALMAVNVIGWAVAAASAIYMIVQQFKDVKKEAESTKNLGLDLVDKQIVKTSAKAATSSQQAIEKFNKSLQGAAGNVLKGQANQTKTLSDEMDVIKGKATEVNDELGNAYKGFTDKLKDNLGEMRKQFTAAESAIKSLKNVTLDFDSKVEAMIYNLRSRYATPQQQLVLDKNEINKLQADADKLFATGNKSDFDEAVKREEQILKLLEKQFETREGISIEQSRDAVKNGVGGDRFTPGTYIVNVESSPEVQQAKAISARLKSERDRQAEIQGQNAAAAKQAEAQMQESLRRAEDAGKKFTSFSILGKDGSVKADYLDPTGKVDPKKIEKAAQDAAEKLSSGIANSGDEEIRLRQAIEDKITQVHKEALAQRRLEDQKDLQERTARSIDEIKRAQNEAENSRKDTISKLFDKGGTLDSLVNQANVLATLPDRLGVDRRRRGLFVDDGPATKKDADLRYYEDLEAKYTGVAKSQRDMIESLGRDARAAAENGASTEELSAIVQRQKEAFDKLTEAVERYYDAKKKFTELRSPNAPRGGDLRNEELRLSGNTTGQGVGAGVAIDAGAEAAAASIEMLNKLNNQESVAKALQTQMEQGKLEQSITQWTLFNQVGQNVKTTFESRLIPATNNLIDAFISGVKRINEQVPMAPVTNIPEQPQGNPFEGAGEFAEGGLVGGPGGIDNVPAWLSRNEYVMPERQTAQFLPLLKAMHYGGLPSYGSGSMVSTTVGDIHVTVQGGSSADKTIRNIGKGLRREILRGNVTLSK